MDKCTIRFHVLTAVMAMLCLISAAPSAKAGVLKLPANLERIEAHAFYGDNSLDEVIIPDKVEYIGP